MVQLLNHSKIKNKASVILLIIELNHKCFVIDIKLSALKLVVLVVFIIPIDIIVSC